MCRCDLRIETIALANAFENRQFDNIVAHAF